MRRLWERWSRRLWNGHPTPEQLSAYQEDRLPPEVDGEIQEHFVDCEECPELMLDLDRFTSPEGAKAAEPDLSDTWVDAAWWRLRFRLGAEAPPARWRWLRGPGLAWCLTAALAPCVFGLWLRVEALAREVRAFEAPQLNPPLWKVEPAPVLRGGDPLPPDVRVPAGARQFLLVFSPAGEPPDREYLLKIRNGQGEDVWAERGLQRSAEGTFVVTVSRRFLPAGSYLFRIIGIGGSGDEPFEEEFPLRLSYL